MRRRRAPAVSRVCAGATSALRSTARAWARSATSSAAKYCSGGEWMFVCFTALTSDERNCTKVSGLTVGRTLRARELLYGWDPAGIADDDKL